MSALWANEDDVGGRSRTSARHDSGDAKDKHTGTVGDNATSKNSGSVNRRRDAGQHRRSGARRSQLSRVPFVLVLIVIFALGMGGLLALNTSLQGQSFQARKLHDRSDKLANREAALNRQAEDLRAPDKVAERAWNLGLRPNDGHAVYKLPDGKVIGKPPPAGKKAMPGLDPTGSKKQQDKKKQQAKEKTKTKKKQEQKKQDQKKRSGGRGGQGD